MRTATRLIAFYLPQFHPIPENDEWWGKGFTEWTNVVRAKSLFKGHYQPHLPGELGFYDLRCPEVREAQAALASEHGIYGFCYYHYWFNGRRLLERPFDEVLRSGRPSLPFCLCWANENWTRAWDGHTKSLLIGQNYSAEDDRRHILHLIESFRDERYIKINGRPLMLIYRAEHLPDAPRTAEIWREECHTAGFPGLFLCRVESLWDRRDPTTFGFDAATEFAPEWIDEGPRQHRDLLSGLLVKAKILPDAYLRHSVRSYDFLTQKMIDRAPPKYKRFPCVCPSWDNTARRQDGGHIFVGSTPEKYGRWLEQAIVRSHAMFDAKERIVFINAWNEWAEGCHLEPDAANGRAYLEATSRAIASADRGMRQYPITSATEMVQP